MIHIAPVLGLSLDRLLEPGATREVFYQQVLTSLVEAPCPTIFVGEDAHWSDEASLNLIRFLGRRLGALRALLIVTYRDDHLDPRHPLRIILGDLATTSAIHRMALPRLSLGAVRSLANGHDVDSDALYQLTAGNPFFVTEILASNGIELPPSVRDAALARAARLSAEGRSVLDAAAVIGIHIEPELLDAVIGGPTDAGVEECLAVGVLEAAGGNLGFRHGIAWKTVPAAISPARSRALNRRALASLEQHPVLRHNHARLAHHAEEAGDRDAVLACAVAAAQQASALGAHREAAAQYDRALRFADPLPVDQRADLLEHRSYECYLTGLLDEAIEAGQAALDLRRPQGDRLKEGDWGERAIALADQLGETEILVHALNNVGSAKLFAEAEAGRASLERSLALARAAGYRDHVSRAISNLAWAALLRFQLPRAERYLAEGIAHTTEHDLDAMGQYLLATRALLRLRQGKWSDAEKDAIAVTRHPMATALARIIALTVLGQIQARRGEASSGSTSSAASASSAAYLDEALALAEPTGELQRLGPVRAARSEAAWLAGNTTLAAAEARAALDLARRQRDRWLTGELALALYRAGKRDVSDEGIAEPFALQLRGDWQAAAAVWEALGCPFESARALADGDEAALRRAWIIFDRLGAQSDAAMVTKRLRALGAQRIPRGPRPSTRANPALLTPRELEILSLIVKRRRNREIADQLYLSPKTVGHHVSTILSKLGVNRRAAAACLARGARLVDDGSAPAQ